MNSIRVTNSKCADAVANVLFELIIKYGDTARVIDAIAKNKGEAK